MPSGTTRSLRTETAISTRAGEQGAKHTPGPWHLSKEDSCVKLPGYVAITGDNWFGLAEVVVEVEGKIDPVGEANASLIAAAPDMLEALQAILPHLEPSHVSLSIARSRADELRDAADRADRRDEAVMKIRLAIRKAINP